MPTFHIGYPKSGSSSIQELLQSARNINFLGKPFRNRAVEYHVRENLTFGDLRQLPAHTLTEMRSVLCQGEPIISDEILSGVGFAHGIAANSLLQIIDNIELLTDGDYVAHVVFRKPEGFLRSYFGQIVRMGGRLTFDQFCSLVLMRPHHWVFRSLDYGALLRSQPFRDGKVRPVLFEDLFFGGQLRSFMQSAFGVDVGADDPTKLWANQSEKEMVVDLVGPHMPVNPASRLELQITRPSMQEHLWVDQLGGEHQAMHRRLWNNERGEFNQLAKLASDLLAKGREKHNTNHAKRPISAPFAALLGAIATVNAGVAEAHPELNFAAHRYFEVPTAALETAN